tara:strand:- start:67 stop:1113 length:1047 start_codon:yes stop_codon:yes gene_type:complete
MKSMLQNDPDRMAMISGGEADKAVPEIMQRINAIIGDEVKFAKEYGDKYFNSGVGLFGRLERSLGDSGEGRRAFDAIQKVNRQMKGEYTNKQIADMLNKGYMDADLPYRFELPKEFQELGQNKGAGLSDAMRDSKADGGPLKNPEKADLDKDGTISDYEQTRGEAIEESMEERKGMQDGGIMNEQMEMLMEEEQVPDDEMEEDYLDFIINEALNPEEEDFLVEQLKDNDKLSEIFDKVIEVASEFTGAGSVEGPGTGVSDSIPARLSDGEFVFTAKATEQIGVDKLMSMMKEAEVAADKRREMQEGGVLSETTTTTRRFADPMQKDEEEVMQDEKTIQDMRGTNPRMQ